MDTTYYSNIPVETLSLLDCDVRNFDFNHPIKNIFFDNIEYIRKLDASGKARPCILDNVERSLLCHTCYLGFDQFECTDCDNWNIIPHSCHSRFCNACGVKYAKQLAAKATSFCLDCPHRHIVFTIPKELRNWFRQARTRLNLLFVAARNTICILVNRSLSKKLRLKQLKNTHYIFKDGSFLMNLAWLPLYILLEGTLNGIHIFIVLYRNSYIRKNQTNLRCSTISIFLGFEKHFNIS